MTWLASRSIKERCDLRHNPRCSKPKIVVRGPNLARKIDDVLYGLNDVAEAAAFARPCPQYGERVEAAIAVIEGSTSNETELTSRCADRLGAFKSPEQIHFLKELPKGPSGKIQRLKLAQLL